MSNTSGTWSRVSANSPATPLVNFGGAQGLTAVYRVFNDGPNTVNVLGANVDPGASIDMAMSSAQGLTVDAGPAAGRFELVQIIQ